MIDKNYTKFDNYLTDNVMKKVSDSEWKILTAIQRFLLGWGITKNWISNSKIEEITGLSDNTIRVALKKIQSYNLIKITQEIKNGIKHQYIEINLKSETYLLPNKEKLTSRVKNFFRKGEKTEEKIQVTPIIIDSQPQTSRSLHEKSTTSNIEEIPPQMSRGDTSNLEDNKHSIKNINNKKHDHDQKQKNTNVMNAFKNFDSLSEDQKIKADILMSFGIETKNKNFLSFLDIEKTEIMDLIAHVEWEDKEGRIKKTKQGFLISLLTKKINEKKETGENQQNNSITQTEQKPKVSNELEKLLHKFKLFFKGKLYASELQQDALLLATEKTLKLNEKSFYDELKQSFSFDEIKAVIESVFNSTEYLRKHWGLRKENFYLNFGV